MQWNNQRCEPNSHGREEFWAGKEF
jgi:hypothetical protein